MKTIIRYQCEICGRRFGDEESARACEALGPAPELPLGTILRDDPNYLGHGDLGLLQVLAAVHNDGRHYSTGSFHTFRDWYGRRREAGDCSPQNGSYSSGPDVTRRLLSKTIPVDTSTPRYRRAWESYREAGLPLFLLVDGEAVPAPGPTEPPSDAPVHCGRPAKATSTSGVFHCEPCGAVFRRRDGDS